ncbi:MAG: RsmB/NOP family class I SAM-dependent RNA methyltransferase [Thermomicrobiales bacterium]|nr:RsmB/NOP family class I SAM-dependent RNA methyltransferase [Thermomicrobiales bacterium]
MSTPPLPTAYVERMTSLLGDEAEAFFASYDRPARSGLRVNLHKISADEFRDRSPWELEPVPWCPEGFYLPEDAPAGKHPWHAAGLYYLQEPSAMAPVEQLPLTTGAWFADVCASPGGKSTQIEPRMTQGSLLVSNEVVGSRIKPLGENLERWGADEAVITSLEVRRLAEILPNMFDYVLVDAPCSGEGLFRRSPEARAEWSIAHVEGSARRQRALLEQAAKLVGVEGTLVYSTCTFAPEENEQVIANFLYDHLEWSLAPIEGFAPGHSDWDERGFDLSEMARLWPHQLEGDGHTIARLVRSGADPMEDPQAIFEAVKEAPPAAQDAFSAFVVDSIPSFVADSVLMQQGELLMLLPSQATDLNALPMVRKGVWAGTFSGGRFTPAHGLAMLLTPQMCRLTEALDFEEAARYLSGETLTKPGKPGWVLIAFDGFPLGWGKRSGDVIKNHYPKGLRRPVASWLSAR